MYFEILVATELLGYTHAEFKRLPIVEQKKLILFYKLKMEKEEYSINELKNKNLQNSK